MTNVVQQQSRMREFIDMGLFEGQQLLVLDLEKCTRCDECVRACADGHVGVTRIIRDGPRFENFLVAISCRSCHDPRCLDGCPVDAIHRQRFGLEILIDPHRCIGCAVCATNCPFGSIRMVEKIDDDTSRELDPSEWASLADRYVTPEDAAETGKIKAKVRAANCDLCSSLLPEQQRNQRDVPRVPRCVYACPHDAAHRMRGQELLRCAELRAEAAPPSGGVWSWLKELAFG